MESDLDLSVCLIMEGALASLRGFLRALAKNADPVSCEVILVHEARQRLSANKLAAEFPGLKIFENDGPATVATLRNHAARITAGRYLLFCQDDILFRPDGLARLLRFLDDTPDAGIAGPRIIDPQGVTLPSAMSFPSLATLLRYRPCLGKFHFACPLPGPGRDGLHSCETDWLAGGFLVIRRELLEETGLFDEGFVSSYADADLCLRAREAGWHIHYRTDTVVQQGRPETSGPPSLPTFADCCRFLLKKWLKPAQLNPQL